MLFVEYAMSMFFEFGGLDVFILLRVGFLVVKFLRGVQAKSPFSIFKWNSRSLGAGKPRIRSDGWGVKMAARSIERTRF